MFEFFAMFISIADNLTQWWANLMTLEIWSFGAHITVWVLLLGSVKLQCVNTTRIDTLILIFIITMAWPIVPVAIFWFVIGFGPLILVIVGARSVWKTTTYTLDKMCDKEKTLKSPYPKAIARYR